MSQAQPTISGAENAAVRKIIYSLAELDGDMVDPEDTNMIEAAVEAAENVADLQQEVERLSARVETLEEQTPDPARKSYGEMDKADKITVVRQKLKDEAENTNGRAAVFYKDVIRMFDGHASAGHAYNLMDAAANDDGFTYSEAPSGEKRLTYRVND